ncbi:MAG: hypothetical protein DRJ61_00015 [Acidobacteria bacterium]|nr:MAG: hypothetical protein DRJ61_00015 [Acidobacteriota bacterium]
MDCARHGRLTCGETSEIDGAFLSETAALYNQPGGAGAKDDRPATGQLSADSATYPKVCLVSSKQFEDQLLTEGKLL